MAHPHHKDSIDNELRRVDRLDLPEAGALSGEGRLDKMKLHEDEDGEPSADPEEAAADEDDAEGDLE